MELVWVPANLRQKRAKILGTPTRSLSSLGAPRSRLPFVALWCDARVLSSKGGIKNAVVETQKRALAIRQKTKCVLSQTQEPKQLSQRADRTEV
jgi:hypothetical protein